MAVSSSDYSRAYETAKLELAELIFAEERLARRKVELRKTIEILGSLCENEQIEVNPSPQAAYLLEHSSLADEIRQVLRSKYPDWLRPLQIKNELEKLGHDFGEHPNPQATIQMVLKRMAESESKEAEESIQDGKKAYRSPGPGLSALTGGVFAGLTPEVINSLSSPFAGIAEALGKKQSAFADLIAGIPFPAPVPAPVVFFASPKRIRSDFLWPLWGCA